MFDDDGDGSDGQRGKDAGQGVSLSYLGALGWTFGISGLTAFIALLASGLRPGGGLDLGTELLATAAATLLLLLAMSRVHAPELALTELVGLRRVPIVLVALALVAGVALVFPLARLDASAAARFPLDEETREYLASDTPRQRVLLSLMVVCGPLLAEVFYRGALFGLLERDKPTSMVVFVITALAVFPPSAHALFSGLAFAAVASHLRGLSGSVWPALALRLGASGVGVVAVLARHDTDEVGRTSAIVGAVAAALALGSFLLLAGKRANAA